MAAGLVVVLELCHGRGDVSSTDLVGVVTALVIGGSAVMQDGDRGVHLPRVVVSCRDQL